MKKKRRLIFIVVLCLLVGSGVRIYQVNHSCKTTEKRYYSVGEKVEFGTDYNVSASEIIDGYAIQVLGAELLEEDAFYEKYHIEGEEREQDDMKGLQYFYVVDAKVSNSKEMKDGVGFVPFLYTLGGKNYITYASTNNYQLINPELPEGGGFSLRKGEEITVKIPYRLFPDQIVEYPNQFVEKLTENPPYIQLTSCPTKKLVATQ